MKIQEKAVASLRPYENNTKIHTPEQVDEIARSIQKFGWKQPIVADSNGVIIVGHGRFEAAKKLGLEKVPVLVADDLTEDEVRAYRITDNKANESQWDFAALATELKEIEIDMTDFGVDFDFDKIQEEHEHWATETQRRVANIQNLEYAEYDGVGKYDIPQLYPVYELPEITEWIGFDEVLQDRHPGNKGVHFFKDDYKFERIWNRPNQYIEKLRQYACVATPDFSPYGDMPMALQIYNHYRKHWVGKFMQENGVTVIPTIRCSTNPESLKWYLDGEPVGGIIIMSSMWTKQESILEISRKEFQMAVKKLKPKKILMFGKDTGTIDYGKVDVEFITDTQDRRIKEFKQKQADNAK